MYLTTEMLGDLLTEILKKEKGEQDLYNIEDVLNIVTNKIDDLERDIEGLKEELKYAKSDDSDILYEMEAGK